MLRGTWLLCASLGKDGVFFVTAALYLTRCWFSINSCSRFSKVGWRHSPVCLQRSRFIPIDIAWL